MRNDIKWKKVHFKPWIGDRYASPQRFGGVRLLIIGLSHYWWEPKDLRGSLTTIKNVKFEVEGERRAFFTKIAGTLIGHLPDDKERRDIWLDVAFYNFIQTHVDYGPTARVADHDWEQGSIACEELLQRLQPSPQCIITLGFSVYDNMPNSFGCNGSPLFVDRRERETYHYNLPGVRALTTWIKHPGRAFSYKTWSPVVQEAIHQAGVLNRRKVNGSP